MAKHSSTAEAAPYLTGPAYAVALLFVVFPLIDTVAQVWPLQLDSPSWRYGAVGLGANYLISALFGMMGLALVAALRQHRRTLLGVTLLNGLGALLLVVGALAFLLDAFQVRAGVPRDDPRTRWLFDVGAAKAVFKYLCGAGLLAWLGLMSWKAGRTIARVDTQAEEDAPRLVSKQQQ
jgi:hypothetical protein